MVFLGLAGTGELQELPEPPVSDAKLDWDGDGVRISELPIWLKPGEDERISKEAARCGDGDLLEPLCRG